MPHADVVVVGAGLAGLVAAARIAESGATVTLVAKGHASTHWGSGGLDVAGPAGAATPAEGVASLAAQDHPYGFLAADVAPSVAWLLERLEAGGLPYVGTLDTPIRRVPTAIGGTRRVAIVPAAQAAALRPWDPDEILVIAGPAGYKDFWPAAIADSLGREAVWMGSDHPDRVVGITVDLDGVADRNNLNALHLARRFDDPALRDGDIARFAAAIKKAAGGRPGRVAVPAIVGLEQPRRGVGRAQGEAAAGAVRDPARPAQHPGHPPLARPARDHPRRGRACAGRRGRRADPRRGRPRHGRGDGGRRTVAGHPDGGAGARHRRHRGRRARGHARGSHRRAAARAARGRRRARGVAGRRCARPRRPPDRGGRHSHGWRPPAAGRGRTARRPSPTSGSQERSSPASGRSASGAATGSPSPAAGGRRMS